MPTVPHPPVPPARNERRWPARVYPGDVAHTARVRADLRADLAGLPDDLIETIVLCASEAFANAAEHTRSGEQGGRVVRALLTPEPGRMRTVIVDDGATQTASGIRHSPSRRHAKTAERGRGLLLISSLADAWGTYPIVPFPFCTDLGTAVWAEFSVPATF